MKHKIKGIILFLVIPYTYLFLSLFFIFRRWDVFIKNLDSYAWHKLYNNDGSWAYYMMAEMSSQYVFPRIIYLLSAICALIFCILFTYIYIIGRKSSYSEAVQQKLIDMKVKSVVKMQLKQEKKLLKAKEKLDKLEKHIENIQRGE